MSILKIISQVCNPLQENSYLVADTTTGTCLLIDPGYYTRQERDFLCKQLLDGHITPTAILLTHSHIDHVLGLAWAVRTFNIPYYQAADDVANLRACAVYAPMYGIPDFEPPATPATIINEVGLATAALGQAPTLVLGGFAIGVLQTPGHAAGHLSFYFEDLGCIVGDTLFAGSIGRTDLPGGNFATLERSIKTQLYTLPVDTVVYPGHGPATSIKAEMESNPYVRA